MSTISISQRTVMPFGNCPANGESFCAALITAVNVEQRLFLMLQYLMYEEVRI
jgi:hypothetical protein